MGMIRGERTVEIDAPLERVFEVAADIEHAPEWQPSLKDVEVLERDGERRATSVDTESDAKVRTIRSRLSFAYDPPTRDHLGRRSAATSRRCTAGGGWRIWAKGARARPTASRSTRAACSGCCCAAPSRARSATTWSAGRPRGSRRAPRLAEGRCRRPRCPRAALRGAHRRIEEGRERGAPARGRRGAPRGALECRLR